MGPLRTEATRRPVGIDRARVYPSSLALGMRELCRARGADEAELREVMMIDERSVNPPWEDPVTMAVNAALPMLTDEDRERIELVLVASESSVDQEKPLSSWVHRYLGLKSSCRNLELKHACYGATAGVRLAASMISAGALRPGARALVISTDQSRTHFGKPWEYVMGCGAAALVVSEEPRLLELEPARFGVYAHEVSDLTRPTSRVETGNSETSLLSYLSALDGAMEDFLAHEPEPVDYDACFVKHIYHVPFGGMTLRAHRAALRHFGSSTKSEARASWERKTAPSLVHNRRMGGTYGASTFVALLGLLDSCPELRAGDRLSMFSYGSGSCAEFYAARLGSDPHAVAREAGLGALLDARRSITVREYEECERERTCWIDDGDYRVSNDGLGDLYERAYRGSGRLVFEGCEEHYRRYRWS